jgi:hypothetical protein
MSPSHPFACSLHPEVSSPRPIIHWDACALRAYASSMTSMQQQLIVTSDDFASKAFQGDPFFHS